MKINKINLSKISREKRIIFFYRFFLSNYSLDDCYVDFEWNNSLEAQEEERLISIFETINLLVDEVKKYLPINWEWDRFGYLEKAILVNGIIEIRLFFQKKSIVINESINLAKKYCDLKAPQTINAILDNFN